MMPCTQLPHLFQVPTYSLFKIRLPDLQGQSHYGEPVFPSTDVEEQITDFPRSIPPLL